MAMLLGGSCLHWHRRIRHLLPAQHESIADRYATSILLQQGEALLNDVVSTSGIFSRASDFVATLPISDPCHPTTTLPSRYIAAAGVHYLLAPEAAVAGWAVEQDPQRALALSNSCTYCLGLALMISLRPALE